MEGSSVRSKWEYTKEHLPTIMFCILAVAVFSVGSTGDDKALEHWGQFGDFIGGVLNPCISFIALLWLISSVRIQKRELAETKDALEKSAKAQLEQVTLSRAANLSAEQFQKDQSLTAERSVRISALSSLINSHIAEINILQGQIVAFISQDGYRRGQGAHNIQGDWIAGTNTVPYLAELNRQIEAHQKQKTTLEVELEGILSAYTL